MQDKKASFEIIVKDGNTRAGILKTAHGEIETPIFMPVGTQASVKAVTAQTLKEVGAQIILGNTYHLYLRPGHGLIKEMGGLHKFMGWDRPILTDSGGFQAFSLGAMIEHGVRKVGKTETVQETERNKKPLAVKIKEEGVEFVSHIDGTKHTLTPEKSIEVQLDLGSDICLVLDELLSLMHPPSYVEKSLARTRRWELRSKEYFEKNVKKSINPDALLFGILQGVYDRDIRESEAKWIGEQGFDGISIGGSFGTSEYWGREAVDPSTSLRTSWAASKAIYETMEWVVPHLPDKLPRHALGIGEVQDLFECVEQGIDMFDCVAPTRRARNGSLYINPKNGGDIKNKFTLSISQSKYTKDKNPIDPGCKCHTCQNFSRGYLRHLYMASEILYHQLATTHNLYFILNLVKDIREAIKKKQFQKLKNSWL